MRNRQSPWAAERIDISIEVVFPFSIPYGYVFYTSMALTPFFFLIFFLGIGAALFALYTLWLPEQYSADCRASAIAFVSSVGRFDGVPIMFLVGAGIKSYGSLGLPVPVTATALLLGLILLPLAVETRGKPLPA